jgi:hypothetical protein
VAKDGKEEEVVVSRVFPATHLGKIDVREEASG